MYWYSRPEGIPQEVIEKAIQRIARIIVERFPGISPVAVFMLELNKPFVYIYAELGRFLLVPLFSMLQRSDEEDLHNYITIFGQRENIEQLIQRIVKLEKETKEKEAEDKEKKIELKRELRSWLKRIF